jgi:hypothetical protein
MGCCESGLCGFRYCLCALRNFWLQRNLYPIPSLPLVIPLTFLPDVTPWIDPIKGIEPHRETQAYVEHFAELDAAMAGHTPGKPLTTGQVQLLERQVALTKQMIDTNPFQVANASGTLEKIKNQMRGRADLDSASQSAALLLSPEWLARTPGVRRENSGVTRWFAGGNQLLAID